jgi:hypothetical protein
MAFDCNNIQKKGKPACKQIITWWSISEATLLRQARYRGPTWKSSRSAPSWSTPIRFAPLMSSDLRASDEAPQLSRFCTELTSIQQSDVDQAPSFKQRRQRSRHGGHPTLGLSSAHLISDKPQQAHRLSQWGLRMGSPSQEVSHDDEPSAVSIWTFDG